MIILGQTASNADTPQYFSTKRTEVPVIKKQTLPEAKDFCTCIVQCVPDLKVFTDTIGTDDIKNDWTSFFMKTINTIVAVGSTITGKIIRLSDNQEFTLTDVTYGELKVGNHYWWYKLDWYKVWNLLGFDRYRIEVTEVGNLQGQTINQLKSVEYRLCPYSDQAAQRTVRIYTKQQGKLHHGNNYSNLTTASISTPFPFEQQTRLPGRLYAIDPEIENDRLVLNNGARSSYQVKDQYRPKYKLDIHLVSSKQINKVVFDELFGSEVLITDYNVYNHVSDPRDYFAEQYIDLPVVRSTTAIPNPSGTSIRKTYTFTLDYDNDNVFKTNN